MRGAALLLAAVAVAGCGKKSQPTGADIGDPEATKAIQVESSRAWLDPYGTGESDDTGLIVVRNTSDQTAVGVTATLEWPQYKTQQQDPIVIGPRQRGLFRFGTFDAPPEVKGQPKAVVKADALKPGPAEPVAEFSDFEFVERSTGCDVKATVENRFTKDHPDLNGLVAGLKDGQVVTGGSVFFEEPGVQPGKKAKFTSTLTPLCPEGEVDEWVGFLDLTEDDLNNP